MVEYMVVTPLISVIVPVFNVERYVRKCLSSLKNQTMNEIEVICIDDGSTDGSGAIADEFRSDEFSIFRIIHTENRGLSAARNRGIEEARSEWIMFVDSDDWVDEKFCEIPYSAAIEHKADMVIFGPIVVKKRHKNRIVELNQLEGVIDEFSAHQFGLNIAWNKLYRRSSFSDIRYPVGRNYEDSAITHILVHNANRIYLINNHLYFYLDRKDSITHSNTVKNMMDRYIAKKELYTDLVSYGGPDEYLSLHKSLLLSAAIGFLSVSPPSNDQHYLNAKLTIDEMSHDLCALTIKQKVALLMWKIDPRLFYMICKVSGRLCR